MITTLQVVLIANIGVALGSPAIIGRLQKLHTDIMLPLETQSFFQNFHNHTLHQSELEAKPIVLLLGQYSTGKTSFIRYVIGQDFLGQSIGPEPTTDRFIAVVHGNQKRIIPGNVATSAQRSPWSGLQNLGLGFLEKFECSEVPAPILQGLTLVDSPGVLSGTSMHRGYDYAEAIKWFANRAQRILLLFDAHTLDIPEEMKDLIKSIWFAQSKIRVVLNKADSLTYQELLRVYGSLTWSLGRIIQTPEPVRIYISSFWHKASAASEHANLFRRERQELFTDLKLMVRDSALFKLEELTKRGRALKAHVCIIGEVYNKLPTLFGKTQKLDELRDNLGVVFEEVERKYQIPKKDFPDLQHFRAWLKKLQLSEFQPVSTKQLARLDQLLTEEIPKLVHEVSKELNATSSPVGHGLCLDWDIPDETHARASRIFQTLTKASSNQATESAVKEVLSKRGLSAGDVTQIMALASLDDSKSFEKSEFIVATHLADLAQLGQQLPDYLPLGLIPPSKRATPLCLDS